MYRKRKNLERVLSLQKAIETKNEKVLFIMVQEFNNLHIL